MQVAHMHNYSDLHPTCQRFPVWNEADYFLKKNLLIRVAQLQKNQTKKKENSSII